MLTVDVAALALLVRSVRTTFADTLVNCYSEPGQRLVDIVLGTGNKTLRVSILDTENHLSAILTGKKPVEQGGADAADMEGTCGRGGKTNSNFL